MCLHKWTWKNHQHDSIDHLCFWWIWPPCNQNPTALDFHRLSVSFSSADDGILHHVQNRSVTFLCPKSVSGPSNWILAFLLHFLKLTAKAPENKFWSQKESHLPTVDFQGQAVSFTGGGVVFSSNFGHHSAILPCVDFLWMYGGSNCSKTAPSPTLLCCLQFAARWSDVCPSPALHNSGR